MFSLVGLSLVGLEATKIDERQIYTSGEAYISGFLLLRLTFTFLRLSLSEALIFHSFIKAIVRFFTL